MTDFWLKIAFAVLLLIIGWKDCRTRRIENKWVLVMACIGVAAAFLKQEPGYLSRLTGVFAVSVPMLFISMLFPGAFGGGDIKLMAAAGLFLGSELIVYSFMAAIVLCGTTCLIMLLLKRMKRRTRFAFGPYLCAGMLICMTAGKRMLEFSLIFS